MASVMPPYANRAMLYTFVFFISMGLFGGIGEYCANLSFSECTSRIDAAIAMGVITAFVGALPAIVFASLQFPASKYIELGFAVFTLIANTALTAVISSPKSKFEVFNVSSPVLLVWASEIFIIAAIYNLIFLSLIRGEKDHDVNSSVPMIPVQAQDTGASENTDTTDQQTVPKQPPQQYDPTTAPAIGIPMDKTTTPPSVPPS